MQLISSPNGLQLLLFLFMEWQKLLFYIVAKITHPGASAPENPSYGNKFSLYYNLQTQNNGAAHSGLGTIQWCH